jgi:hypothetical protein
VRIKICSEFYACGYAEIEAEVVSGLEGTFAVHPRHRGDDDDAPDPDTADEWAVTHVRTGYAAICNLPSKEIAEAVALQLFEFDPDLWATDNALMISKQTPTTMKMWLCGLYALAEAGLSSSFFYWVTRTLIEFARFEKIHDSLPDDDDDDE